MPWQWGAIVAGIAQILRGDKGLIQWALLRRTCDRENARYSSHRSPPVAFRVRTERFVQKFSREGLQYRAHLVLECGASA